MIRPISELYNFINKEDALKLYNRCNEKKIYLATIFESKNLDSLGRGVYIFVNCFMEICYIGYSKDMSLRIKRHNKYIENDTIITINVNDIDIGKDLENELILLFKPKRNKIKRIYGRK